jgi:hypothetical protein
MRFGKTPALRKRMSENFSQTLSVKREKFLDSLDAHTGASVETAKDLISVNR